MMDPRTNLCFGCGRTLPEIARWHRMDGAERLALMAQLPAHFDHVLVDTPAAAYGADALAIADRCGAALLVGRRDRSRLASLDALSRELAEVPGRLVGLVVNEF